MRIVNKNELEDDHPISNTGDYKRLRVGIMIRRKIRREVGVNDKLQEGHEDEAEAEAEAVDEEVCVEMDRNQQDDEEKQGNTQELL